MRVRVVRGDEVNATRVWRRIGEPFQKKKKKHTHTHTAAAASSSSPPAHSNSCELHDWSQH